MAYRCFIGVKAVSKLKKVGPTKKNMGLNLFKKKSKTQLKLLTCYFAQLK